MFRNFDLQYVDTEIFSEEFVVYLKNRGWRQTESGSDIAVMRKIISSQEEEIVLPIDRSFTDYRLRLFEAICFLSKIEKRSENDLIEELLKR